MPVPGHERFVYPADEMEYLISDQHGDHHLSAR